MIHLKKEDLIDLGWYYGVVKDIAGASKYACGYWDALNNRFAVLKHTADETYHVPMVYPGDESEYFLTFTPYYSETKEQKNG